MCFIYTHIFICVQNTLSQFYIVLDTLKNSIKIPNNLISTLKLIGDKLCQKTY